MKVSKNRRREPFERPSKSERIFGFFVAREDGSCEKRLRAKILGKFSAQNQNNFLKIRREFKTTPKSNELWIILHGVLLKLYWLLKIRHILQFSNSGNS